MPKIKLVAEELPKGEEIKFWGRIINENAFFIITGPKTEDPYAILRLFIGSSKELKEIKIKECWHYPLNELSCSRIEAEGYFFYFPPRFSFPLYSPKFGCTFEVKSNEIPRCNDKPIKLFDKEGETICQE